MRAIGRVLGIVVVLAAVLVPATAAVAAGGITVTPTTGLVDGQTVSVHGTGWTPRAVIGFCQAVRTPPPTTPPSPSDCASGLYSGATASASGEFTAPLTLKRFVYIPTLQVTVDCADPSAGSADCFVGAADTGNVGATAVFAPLAFTPAAPRILPGKASVLEGDTATTSLSVPVTLSFPSDQTVTADWTTVFVSGAPGNQADPATDYTPTSGTATFAAGDTAETVTLSVNGDLLDEPKEYIVVVFSNPTNASIGGFYGIAFGGITNDDRARVTPGAASVFEGDTGETVDLTVPVTLAKPSPLTVTADWTTVFVSGAPGSQADPATDYTPTSGTVTFAPGDTAETVTISVNGDLLDEPTEYIVVVFSNPTNADIGGYYGIGFGGITNDDQPA